MLSELHCTSVIPRAVNKPLHECLQLPGTTDIVTRRIRDKKHSCRKETVRLLRESVMAKCNWETIFCGHYRSVLSDSPYATSY